VSGEPSPAQGLVLELVRASAASMPCPWCRRLLRDCRLALRQVELDRITVEVTCPHCGHADVITVCPQAQGGTATVR
jgi:predicted RNA-binding Zn-ribbon protein involved in translation (DUF1610 family)